jgi:hypothetical protein
LPPEQARKVFAFARNRRVAKAISLQAAIANAVKCTAKPALFE